MTKTLSRSRVVDQRGGAWEEKMTVNRQRFNRRYRDAIKKAVEEQLQGKGIVDITGDGHLVVEIDPMRIPTFQHDFDSVASEAVVSGNNIFHKGDRIPKQAQGEGKGPGKGGGTEKGERIRVPITKEEWVESVFHDLELPDMVVKMLATSDELRLEQRGFSSVGPAQLLDLKRTVMRSDGRLQVIEQQIEDELEEERQKLQKAEAIIAEEKAGGRHDSERLRTAESDKAVCLKRIRELTLELGGIPEFEKMDLRYRHHEKVPIPVTEAVVFFELDVSGSMDDEMRRLALLLFRFQYLFLAKMYRRVHVVLIHYQGEAYECKSLEEFFSTAGGGGTVYSSAAELEQAIQKERFPADRYNVYVTHASDGDNASEDRDSTMGLMGVNLRRTQYYVYVQISNPRQDTEFWRICRALKKTHPQVAMVALANAKDILPVFRGLFRKKGVRVK